jgi:hypothetical protein
MTGIPYKKWEIWTQKNNEGREYEVTQGEEQRRVSKTISVPHGPEKEWTLPASPFWTSSFQSHEKINVCCLCHPVCGILL